MATPFLSPLSRTTESHIGSSFTEHVLLFTPEVARLEHIYRACDMIAQSSRMQGQLLASSITTRAHDFLHTLYISPYDGHEAVVLAIAKAIATGDILTSLIMCAREMEYISDNNTQILLREIGALRVLLLGRIHTIDDDIEKFQNKIITTSKETESFDIDIAPLFDTPLYTHTPRQSVQPTPTFATPVSEHKESLVQSVSDASTKDARHQKIAEIIHLLGEVTIRDIATRIMGISEKTLQRDIQEMIDEGKVTRMGERRWSKYRMHTV